MPYAFVGAAWKRYEVLDQDANTASMSEDDNVGEVPFGAGISFRYAGFVADARFELRPAFDNELLPVLGTSAELHNWSANTRVGWEF